MYTLYHRTAFFLIFLYINKKPRIIATFCRNKKAILQLPLYYMQYNIKNINFLLKLYLPNQSGLATAFHSEPSIDRPTLNMVVPKKVQN